MENKYTIVEVVTIGREEYQEIMCYEYVLVPICRFITNRKISSVYRKSKRILARNVQ